MYTYRNRSFPFMTGGAYVLSSRSVAAHMACTSRQWERCPEQHLKVTVGAERWLRAHKVSNATGALHRPCSLFEGLDSVQYSSCSTSQWRLLNRCAPEDLFTAMCLADAGVRPSSHRCFVNHPPSMLQAQPQPQHANWKHAKYKLDHFCGGCPITQHALKRPAELKAFRNRSNHRCSDNSRRVPSG